MTASDVPLLNVQINGEWIKVPKGTRLIEACMQKGHFVPHYCYHPKLSSPGNCRMCLIELGSPKLSPDRKPIIGQDGFPEINWSPRPAISCTLEVSEGMAVRTNSPLVEECRKGVMEFLLINHPLDCPICDQAGECKLQEFSVEFGKGESRFLEDKVKKPKRVDIGDRIVLDDERCILCSRCIRFMQEIAKDDVLGFVNRGSHTTLTVYPGKRLNSNYSLNTVDICPVGALTSKDFRFKMRVWFLRETKSIDVYCGNGNNILIGSRENTIYRITPRQNDAVNSCWMPDSHRLAFHEINSPERLQTPFIRGTFIQPRWSETIQSTASALAKSKGSLAIIASARMTLEEMFLTRRLASILNVNLIDVLPRPQKGDGFLIANDGNPNTVGAKLIGLATGKLTQIAELVNSGQLTALLVLGEDATECGILPESLEKLQNLITMAILPNRTTSLANIILPSASWAEKRGSMINIRGRIQRLNRAINPPGQARDDWEILRDLIQALSGSNGIATIEEVFRQLTSEFPQLDGLTLSKIGDLGLDLSDKLGNLVIEKSPPPVSAPGPV